MDQDVGGLHIAVGEAVLVHFSKQGGKLVDEDESDAPAVSEGDQREDGGNEEPEVDGGFYLFSDEDAVGEVWSDSSFENGERQGDGQLAM